jgi:NAD+ diphosphatase
MRLAVPFLFLFQSCYLAAYAFVPIPFRTKSPHSHHASFLALSQQGNVNNIHYSTNGNLTTASQQHSPPWYSDPTIGRDKSHVVNNEEDMLRTLRKPTSKYITITKQGILHLSASAPSPLLPDTNTNTNTNTNTTVVTPLYTPATEFLEGLAKKGQSLEQALQVDDGSVLAWVGEYAGNDFWVAYYADEDLPLEFPKPGVVQQPLREFGDQLQNRLDAAILATANGLVEFHKAHPFCAGCGSRTVPHKAGACRKCTGCGKSTYPRIDVAAIMLITSPCSNYALLGRKANWPKGLYSTLAGFAEVGETLEECCRRETYEESGVTVDPLSVQFVASQPWPFPKSLMAGFVAKAMSDDDSTGTGTALPTIQIDPNEMEDVQWFAKDYVKERLAGGSTALGYQPSEMEAEFYIPGKASLARSLITQWAES